MTDNNNNAMPSKYTWHDVYKRQMIRTDAWAKQETKADASGKYIYKCQKYDLTTKIIDNSLTTNNTTIGAYTVLPVTNEVINPTVDIDNHPDHPNTNVVSEVMALYNAFVMAGMYPYIEASSGILEHGAHVGVFCPLTNATVVKEAMQAIVDKICKGHEVNPKQDTVEEGKYGNLVKLIGQYHNRTKSRSKIINPVTLQPFPTEQEGIDYIMGIPDTIFSNGDNKPIEYCLNKA